MTDRPWSEALSEWVYGPARDEDDEPLNVGDMYRIQEEEERIRWIPGYRELVERYLAALDEWHAAWVPGETYPEMPAIVAELRERISSNRATRAVPPWEAAAPDQHRG